ncbi:hypothetical protein RD792_003552 [Penstemon davidsonii]|uniref:GDSL esterase/lipase n=1 Tax=Penstemon davidsonii TaxID=160366 RepID=A0ABR0DU21_9LAMI|nr:hypothetical protein RD792_003552 [Penstemon davidsonii]
MVSRKYQTTKVTTVYAIVFILLVPSSSSFNWGSECYKSIISFGDSLQDTGNLPLLRSPNNTPASALPPFGKTFFHHPNGRYSDGRLVIDFIADSLELPFVEPYLSGRNGNFSSRVFEKGVNFAVAGATALDMDFFNKRGINNPMTNMTLGDELVWFKQFFTTLSGMIVVSINHQKIT